MSHWVHRKQSQDSRVLERLSKVLTSYVLGDVSFSQLNLKQNHELSGPSIGLGRNDWRGVLKRLRSLLAQPPEWARNL